MFEILRAKTRERKWLCVCVERESKRAKGIDKWKKSVNKELEHTLMKVRPTKKWINRGLYKINTKIKLDRYNKHKILKREREKHGFEHRQKCRHERTQSEENNSPHNLNFLNNFSKQRNTWSGPISRLDHYHIKNKLFHLKQINIKFSSLENWCIN